MDSKSAISAYLGIESDDAESPNTLELQADAQKPADCPTAEYSATEEIETPEDLEKANESTFLGVAVKNKALTSAEAFMGGTGKGMTGIGLQKFDDPKDFLKSEAAIKTIPFVEKWCKSKNFRIATKDEVENWLNTTVVGKMYRRSLRRFGNTSGYAVGPKGAVFAYYNRSLRPISASTTVGPIASAVDELIDLKKRRTAAYDIFLVKIKANGTEVVKAKRFGYAKIGKDVKIATESTNPIDIAFSDML